MRYKKYKFFLREYKKDWEKMKIKRDIQRRQTEKEHLEKAANNSTGENIPFVTAISSGREISDIYLKHAGNESSEDEEGTENSFHAEESEEEDKEAESFKNFLNRHKMEQKKRTFNQPTTSSST